MSKYYEYYNRSYNKGKIEKLYSELNELEINDWIVALDISDIDIERIRRIGKESITLKWGKHWYWKNIPCTTMEFNRSHGWFKGNSI